MEQAQFGGFLDFTLSKRSKIEEKGESYPLEISWAFACMKTDYAKVVHSAT